MSWASDYAFEEPLVDLRESRQQAASLEAELSREVPRGHPLHGRTWRVIARAMPHDDVVNECEDLVAIVHLTWTGKRERLPFPQSTFLTSAGDFATYARDAYDWDA